MDQRETWLIASGFMVGVILVAGLFVAFNLAKQIHTTTLLNQIPLKKPLSMDQLTSILSKASGNSSVSVDYSGFLKFKSTSGSTTTTANVNISVSKSRSGSSSTLNFSYIVPSSYSNTQVNYTESLLKNGSTAYYCGSYLSRLSLLSLSANTSCVDAPTIAVLENTSYNYSVAFFNFLSMKGLHLTINNASEIISNKNQCTLVNGTLSGSVPAYQLENIVSSLSGYGISAFPSYEYGITPTAIFSGTFRACISNKYLVPLNISATVRISGLQQMLSMQLFLNETSISNYSSPVSPDNLPGNLVNLSSVLRGTCYQQSMFGYSYNNPMGYCENPIMNLSGTLMANFTSYSSIYIPQYYRPTTRILGIACTQNPLYNSSKLPMITTSIYPYTNSYAIPSISNFTAVNITVNNYGNTTVYFQCPVSNAKLGSKFYGILWVYSNIGSSYNLTAFSTYAYVTTRSQIGSNMNTGEVHPLPPSFPITFITITASDYQDFYGRDLQIFIDKYPGAYQGGGIYQNRSNYTTYVSSYGSTVAYATNLTGTHTVYMLVGQSGGSSYGTYSGSITIGNSTIDFSGVDASHAVKMNITDSVITNSETVSLNESS